MPDGASLLEEREGDPGIGQCGKDQVVLDVGAFGFLGAQEFAARGQVVKELAGLDAGARGRSSGFDLQNFSTVNDDRSISRNRQQTG